MKKTSEFLLLLVVIIGLSACKKTPEETGIPTLRITLTHGISWDKKKKCTIHYLDGRDSVLLEAKIKPRGASSSKYDKHSYALELKKKVALAGLPAEDDWVLNASYIDKTFMRHKLSFDLFREMDPENVAPQCAYINVYLDTTYHGLYVLMQRVDAKLTGLDKKDPMAMLFKEPPVFFEEKLSYVQDSLDYYQQKFPKKEEEDKSAYLDSLHRFLFYADDATFRAEVENWFDLKNIADWHLLLLFTNNGDGVLKNFYLYKKDRHTPLRIALWDYDHSFGRDGDNELNLMEREAAPERAVLIKRLLETDAGNYRDRLQKRWKDLQQKNILTVENVNRHLTANDKIIASEVSRNFERWPTNSPFYHDHNGYEAELEIIRRYTEMRIPYLDRLLDTLGANPTAEHSANTR